MAEVRGDSERDSVCLYFILWPPRVKMTLAYLLVNAFRQSDDSCVCDSGQSSTAGQASTEAQAAFLPSPVGLQLATEARAEFSSVHGEGSHSGRVL